MLIYTSHSLRIFTRRDFFRELAVAIEEVLVLGTSWQARDGSSFCVIISRAHSCSNDFT